MNPIKVDFHQLTCYWSLLKPRVMSLVVFTGIVGLYLAPGSISLPKALIAIVCIALGSGAAGALNMWYERDVDALMERTKNRPLPQGKIQPAHALLFALILAVGSVFLMAVAVNTLSAFYLASAILFYTLVYTVSLKRRTSQNIVIGGAAGALPPLIGWAAVMNETMLLPWILFGIIFLWTPPHFWALALYQNEDYKRAKIPMLPVVAGVKTTKNHILIYIIALVALSVSPVFLGDLGVLYGAIALVLGLLFIGLGLKLQASSDPKEGWRLFLFSIFYLFLLFVAMVGDKILTKVLVL
jgi:heme o synthase